MAQDTSVLSKTVVAARRAFLAVAVFSFAINILMLAVPIYMMQLFDRVLATRNIDTLLALTAIVLMALLVMATMDALRGRLLTRISTWFDRQLAVDVLDGSVAIALRGGPVSAQGLRDVGQVRQFLGGPMIAPFFDAPWTPIFLGVVFLVDPLLGWIATGGTALLFLLAILGELLTRTPLKEANSEASQALNQADAAVRNADVIAAMGMMPALAKRWSGSGDSVLTTQTSASDLAGVIASLARFIRLTLQVGMLGTGAWLATQQVISGGAMIAASIIMGRALAPVEQSINAWKAMVAARLAYRRVKAILGSPLSGESETTLPRPSGRLEVEGLTFRPEGRDSPVLSRVSFSLSAGETLGLIGPSAAGKTTLARTIVASLIPTIGAVRLDGMDVSKWDSADRGRHVGYLPQDIELFPGTVRDNIARMQETDDEAVIAAAQLAGVHDVILRLPAGYDTLIGPGGVVLSGGQKQRIGLARAVFGEPCLVVLDEPNSNLDSEGEHALLEAVGRLRARGTTIVMIAHRPSVLAQVDKILVLKDGMVNMFGPRDEILAKLNQAVADAKGRRGPRPVPSAVGQSS